MARITNFLKLFLPEADDVYNVEKDQNENFEKIDTKLKEWDTGKENTITKKTGFNLDKTNLTENDSNKLFTAKGALDLFNNLTTAISTAVEAAKTALRVDIAKKIDKTSKSGAVNSTSSETVATSLAVKTAYDKGVAALTEAQKKENAFAKNTAHNKNFGTTAGTVLEGDKITQMTGKTYGGILNVAGTKTAGLTYFDNNTKKLFLCKNNNSDTSANVNNYIALDNNSILERLENLFSSGSSNNINWVRLANGLLIQWGSKVWGEITLPQSYTSVDSFSVVSAKGNPSNSNWMPSSYPITAGKLAKNKIFVQTHEKSNNIHSQWITIGF